MSLDECVKLLAQALKDENLQAETPKKSIESTVTPNKTKYGEFEN
jgi:hypothetical protein